jgi:predicted O-linked N-acetylglucosamine transferase (SPINDLY family)
MAVLVEELFTRAIASFQAGRLEDAERCFTEVLQYDPKHVAALNLLGILLTHIKRYPEAERVLQSALNLNSNSDASFYNYGVVLKALKRPGEALECFNRALAINSAVAETWNNRGTVFNDLIRYVDAISDFNKAVALNPNYSEAFCNKGKSCGKLKRYDEALAAYDKALALKPDLAEAWLGRGDVFNAIKRHEEAAGAYAELLKMDPRFPFAKGGLLHQKMLSCDWKDVDNLVAEIERDIVLGKLSAEPFGWQGVAKSQRNLQLCAKLYNKERFPTNFGISARRALSNHGKVRIGYLSGELRDHATSHLIVGILEHHDHSRFEIYGIDNGWDDKSEIRRRINAAVDNIIDIRQLGDELAVAAIQNNQIDILVDLNGYFGEPRMAVLARRCAPIQVNYLGFPGTLGADYIDYIIADQCVIPENHKEFFTEKVVYLPHCYQANDDQKKMGTYNFTRAELGLPEEAFVFCCFNNNYKIVPNVFECWMRILKQIKGSVLWLIEDNTAAASNLRKEAIAREISAERLVFARGMPLSDHLARHRLGDLFLDTLPYNAHTTGSDALWAGLPILTQIGDTFAGRVAASLLHAIGLPELITRTKEEYEWLAIELATHPTKLEVIKEKLAQNRLTTPLFNTQTFTRHIESAYTIMYDRYQAGLPHDHISVSDI